MKSAKHSITETTDADYYSLTCSCGWTFSTTRFQSAAARRGKLDAAEVAHLALTADTIRWGDARSL